MTNKTILWLTVGGLLALAVGCGKTENPAAPTTQADKTAEKPGGQPTNAVVASTDAAKTTVDTGAKAADTVVPPVTEAATKAARTSNAAPDKPQGVVSQAQTTLAGLSQVLQKVFGALKK